MKKTLILILVLAVSITAISVCSVSAADGAFYKFRLNLDFDSDNPSYLFQYPLEFGDLSLMDGRNQIFFFDKLDPADYDGDYATFEFKPDTYGQQLYTGLVMPFGLSTLTLDGSIVRMTTDDTLYLDEGRFFVSIDTEQDAIIGYRFTLRPVYHADGVVANTFGGVYAYTDTMETYISEGSRKTYFDYPLFEFNYTEYYEDGVDTPVFLCVEFLFSTADDLDITVMNTETSTARLFYAQGSSPNNPIYPPADGGNVGNLDNAEQELIGSQQQGLDNTGTVIGNAENVILDLNTELQLGSFVMALNPILDKITTIAGIDALVNMSLALGLFASLLSLTASIIGAGDKRESAQRKKDRNAKSATADRYADKGGGD